MNEEFVAPIRRLPVYMVIGCPSSMSGEPIEAVRMGLRALLSDLQQDAQALETVWLSVITFGNTAKQAVPLTEVGLFQEPEFEVDGDGRALGDALRLLAKCIDKEVREGTTTQKGDWKPIVFLVIDGPPSDDWGPTADKLKTADICNVIACAAGPGADIKVLKRITDAVIQLKDTTPGTLGALMKWVSPTVKSSSSFSHL